MVCHPVLGLILLAALPQQPGTKPAAPAETPAPARNPGKVAARAGGPRAAPVVVRDPGLVRIRLRVGDKLVWMEPRPTPAVEEDAGPVAPQLQVLDIEAMAFASESLDEMIFQDDRATLDARREQLHRLLTRQIKAIDGQRSLTDSQRKRLELAGTGDIERFFARVATAREDFEANRMDFRRGWASLNRLEPLAHDYAQGLLGANSLFAKTYARMTLDAWARPFSADGGMELMPR